MPEAAPVAAPETAAAPPPPEPTLEALAATLFKPDAEAPAEGSSDPTAAPPAVSEEPEAEAPKDPQAEKIGARVAAAKRAELQAERERKIVRSEKAALDARIKELDAREKRIKLIEEDPVRFFEEFKSDPKTFLEKLAGEHKPENVAAKETEALKAKLADLEKKIDDRETAKQQQAAKAQSNEAWTAACTDFISHVEAGAEKYPNLVSEYTEQQATEEAYAALTEVVGHDESGKPVSRTEAYRAQFGAYPDNDVIAEFLDARAKARIEARANSAWRKRNGENGASPSQGKTPGDSKPAAQTVRGSSPRTLTSRASSEKATAPKPWSQEAADEESIRIIEAGFKKS